MQLVKDEVVISRAECILISLHLKVQADCLVVKQWHQICDNFLDKNLHFFKSVLARIFVPSKS